MTFVEIMEHVARGFEIVAAAVLIFGLVWAGALSLRVWRRSGGEQAYQTLRRSIGGVLLLGIEVLVAADLMENVAVLGLIVVIRTVLSFSLEIEMEGVPPWRRAAVTGVGHIARVTRDNRAVDGDTPVADPGRPS
jgi:uncharacterized membrane protein